MNLSYETHTGGEGKFRREWISSDYERIRKGAADVIDMKIRDAGPKAPEIPMYEAAKEKLTDDRYIAEFAVANRWQNIRDNSTDLEKTDDELSRAIALAVLGQH